MRGRSPTCISRKNMNDVEAKKPATAAHAVVALAIATIVRGGARNDATQSPGI